MKVCPKIHKTNLIFEIFVKDTIYSLKYLINNNLNRKTNPNVSILPVKPAKTVLLTILVRFDAQFVRMAIEVQ